MFEVVQMSPPMYLQFVTTMAKSYVHNVSKIEEKRNRLEKVLHKLETIAGQVILILTISVYPKYLMRDRLRS